MLKIILIYPPFCTPASPPYSITYLYNFLKKNISIKKQLYALDLNLVFHQLKFKSYQNYFKSFVINYDKEEYEKRVNAYKSLSEKCYSENNKKVLLNKKPEYFEILLKLILEKKPDIVAFSIVYSSQVFYSYALIKELKKRDINVVVGGPAITQKLSRAAKQLTNEIELLEFIENKKIAHNKLNFERVLDFSMFDLKNYFTPVPVIPLKTTTTCYWKKCAFCTHYTKAHYFEFPLDEIKKTIVNSKQKYFFFIDDMLHKKRLNEIAKIMQPLSKIWMTQLKPTADLNFITLKELRKSGLRVILWGVESGSDRILQLMNKGTNKNDIEKVLRASHKAGIKNVVYVMFGFPTETKDDFLETINFLKKNSEYIDLISSSVFGLQKGSKVYEEPEKFGITQIVTEKRTLLEPKLSYNVKQGLSSQQAEALKKKYKKTIEAINKYPKAMNFFREHMLILQK